MALRVGEVALEELAEPLDGGKVDRVTVHAERHVEKKRKKGLDTARFPQQPAALEGFSLRSISRFS